MEDEKKALQRQIEALQREIDKRNEADVEQVLQRGKSETVRVNFNMDRSGYEVLQALLEQSGQSVSAVMRLLVRRLIRERRKETFAASIVSETGPMKEEKANVA